MSTSPRLLPLAEVSDLMAPGQPLPFRIVDRQGRLLLAAGQTVHDARQLSALLERGACVESADAEAARQARSANSGAGAVPSARRRTWFDRFEQHLWAFDALLRALGREAALAARIDAFGDEHVDLVERQTDAALFVAVRQDDRRFALYGLTHALHTATVVLLTARQLGWPAPQLRRAVLAALTMNASITELQARMAEQADPPTRRQIEQIRAHPHESAQMLRASGVSDAEWLSAVEDHHERSGGAGYPRGLTEVGEIAHLLRAADVFAAKITPRALRTSMPPQRAARELFQQEQGGPMAGALIKAVGIYPPGDFVRLKNGETAIVVQRAVAGQAAQVTALFGANGKPHAVPPRRDTAAAEFAIAGAVADRSGLPRVLPEQVFGLLEAGA